MRDRLAFWLMLIAWLAFGALVGLLVVHGVRIVPANAQDWRPTVRQDKPAAIDLDAAKRQVREGLREPASAIFGKTWEGRAGTVCGYVNARNGFGGMSGLQPFVVPRGGRPYVAQMVEIAGKAVADGPDQAQFSKAWNRDCAGT